MNPKLVCSGFALIVFLLVGCKTDTIRKDEKLDPVLVEYPIVYIERSLFRQDNNNSNRIAFSVTDPAQFNPGAKLIVKNNAFVESNQTDISSALFVDDQGISLPIDIRDLHASEDGQSFLVSIRAPTLDNVDDNEQPTWNIWQYQLATKTLERVIISDITAEQGDDLMASYLPDGRILFASTRQRLSRAILLDEGKPQYSALNERGGDTAFNLHVMQADGSDIQQISFNMSSDFYPLVLQDGRILYSRWDAMGGQNKISLYRMNPDGTDNELIFGWHSQQVLLDGSLESISYIKAQQMPSGEILMLLGSQNEEQLQKRPIFVNINDYMDQESTFNNASTAALTEVFSSEQYRFTFHSEINTSGRLSYLYPLPDSSERLLLSWDLCRIIVEGDIKACGQLTAEQLDQEGVTLAEPWYELWLYNGKDNTQQLVAKTTEGMMLSEAIVLQESERKKQFIADKSVGTDLSAALVNQQAGAIHIRSVYDIDGVDTTTSPSNPEGIKGLSDPLQSSAADRPARFLRLVRGVPLPPRDVKILQGTDFGRSRNQLMREILGYTPIQPDGSVKVKVPANVPLALSIVDAKGQRISGRHRQWISVKAGETLQCHGCHTRSSELPHGRLAAQADSINTGADTSGNPFNNTTSLITPVQGQTMAQASEMVHGIAELSSNLQYRDIWTNSQLSTMNPDIDYTYESLETLQPEGSFCFQNWNAYCRIQINYVDHIQPLWQLPRQQYDEDTAELIADNTCTSCHSAIDKDQLSRVPEGQLDLTNTPSIEQAEHLTSYRELLFNDVEQVLIDGVIVDRLVELLDDDGNVVFQRDDDGELILDEEGNPIPVLTTVNIPAILSTQGSRASRDFFELFNQGKHQGMLSVHELRLLSEWLDIGGQYYNTPFYPEN